LKDRRDRTSDYQKLVAFCDNDEDRAQALLVQLKLRHAFPVTYAEATANTALPAAGINWPPHKAYAGVPNVSAWPADDQSAVLLRLALERLGAGGNTLDSDEVTASARIEYTPPGGSGAAGVFKDSYGLPIRFRRFYESAELNQAPYANTKDAMDPFDPQRKLQNWNPNPATKKTDAQTLVGTTFDGNNKVLTAYSAGADKAFGTGDDAFAYRTKKLGGKGAP
jgi:hypothetical protein